MADIQRLVRAMDHISDVPFADAMNEESIRRRALAMARNAASYLVMGRIDPEYDFPEWLRQYNKGHFLEMVTVAGDFTDLAGHQHYSEDPECITGFGHAITALASNVLAYRVEEIRYPSIHAMAALVQPVHIHGTKAVSGISYSREYRDARKAIERVVGTDWTGPDLDLRQVASIQPLRDLVILYAVTWGKTDGRVGLELGIYGPITGRLMASEKESWLTDVATDCSLINAMAMYRMTI